MSSVDGMDGGWDTMLQNNIVGVYNVLEAARQARVSRVVLASSGATVNGYEREEPYSRLVATGPVDIPVSWKMINEFAEPKPVSIYGVTKLFGEDLGRYFAPSRFRGEWRCDLHPRWNHNGRRVAFDSTHEGWRALYVLDLNNKA